MNRTTRYKSIYFGLLIAIAAVLFTLALVLDQWLAALGVGVLLFIPDAFNAISGATFTTAANSWNRDIPKKRSVASSDSFSGFGIIPGWLDMSGSAQAFIPEARKRWRKATWVRRGFTFTARKKQKAACAGRSNSTASTRRLGSTWRCLPCCGRHRTSQGRSPGSSIPRLWQGHHRTDSGSGRYPEESSVKSLFFGFYHKSPLFF